MKADEQKNACTNTQKIKEFFFVYHAYELGTQLHFKEIEFYP